MHIDLQYSYVSEFGGIAHVKASAEKITSFSSAAKAMQTSRWGKGRCPVLAGQSPATTQAVRWFSSILEENNGYSTPFPQVPIILPARGTLWSSRVDCSSP